MWRSGMAGRGRSKAKRGEQGKRRAGLNSPRGTERPEKCTGTCNRFSPVQHHRRDLLRLSSTQRRHRDLLRLSPVQRHRTCLTMQMRSALPTHAQPPARHAAALGPPSYFGRRFHALLRPALPRIPLPSRTSSPGTMHGSPTRTRSRSSSNPWTLRSGIPSPTFLVFVSLRATPSAIFHGRQNPLRNRHYGGRMTFVHRPLLFTWTTSSPLHMMACL